jgi:IclR family pca regulon transcriptional regulator
MLTFVHMLPSVVRMVHRTDFIVSFAKGLRVLECFRAETPRQSVSEIAAATGLDRATARRCLLTLTELGYAEYDGKYFQLTPRVLRLGMGALAALPLPQIVQPWLDQLSARTGQSSSVSILDETEIVYIARSAATRIMSIGLMPGSRLPAHCTSMGRVLLSALPEEEARKWVDLSDLAPRTMRSRTDPDAIMAELAVVRAQGYSVIDQEVEIGLRSIAVPLYDIRGRVVAALNLGIAASDAPASELAERFIAPLREAQSGLRRVLQ